MESPSLIAWQRAATWSYRRARLHFSRRDWTRSTKSFSAWAGPLAGLIRSTRLMPAAIGGVVMLSAAAGAVLALILTGHL